MKIRIIFAVFFFILIIAGKCYCQPGIKIGYGLADNSKANEYLGKRYPEFNLFRNNYNLGIGYQYVFEGTGMSLIPGIVYSFSKTNVGNANLKLNKLSFELPFKFFPFNMEGDCNCPDFSMRNKFFEKHFFILINSGVNYSFKNNSAVENSSIKDISYTTGIGAGITIPLFKNIILSPGINYKGIFNDKWNNEFLFSLPEEEFNTSSSELELEIRMVYLLIR
jgi:hypothetical protein